MAAARTCASCNTRRVATKAQDLDAHNLGLCSQCDVEAGLENEHSDGYHTEGVVDGCPSCQDLAPVEAGRTTAPAKGTSHAACAHVSTKAARATCRRQRAARAMIVEVAA